MKANQTVVLMSLLCAASAAYADDQPQPPSTETAAGAAADATTGAATGAAAPATGESPAVAAPAAPVVPPPPPYNWSGTVSGALVWLSGNSKSITGSGTLSLAFEYAPWTFGLKANGVYGESKSNNDSRYSVTASNAMVELKGGRNFNEWVGLYLLGMTGYDRVGKIDWRVGGEAGVSVTLLKLTEGPLLKRQLKLESGARYVRESWHQFFPDKTGGPRDLPDADIVFVRVGASFRYAFNERTTFVQTLDLLPDVITPSNFNVAATSSLQVHVWGPMAVSTNWVFKFDNLPPPGAENYDSQLSVGLDLTF